MSNGANVGPYTPAADTAPPYTGTLDFSDVTISKGGARHWFEIQLVLQSTVANTILSLRLYEGPAATPGAQALQMRVWAAIASVPFSAFIRGSFNPTAGTRHYHIRSSANGGIWTILGSNYATQMLLREATV